MRSKGLCFREEANRHGLIFCLKNLVENESVSSDLMRSTPSSDPLVQVWRNDRGWDVHKSTKPYALLCAGIQLGSPLNEFMVPIFLVPMAMAFFTASWP